MDLISAEQLVGILEGSCIPQGVATTDAGWRSYSEGSVEFDDCEGEIGRAHV